MTIVAVFRGSDDMLYLGTDSQWTDTDGLKHHKNKLQHRQEADKHIEWGTAGNPDIGIREFGAWIDTHPWAQYVSWQDFIVDTAIEFARLNAVRKKIGEIARESIGNADFVN